MNITTWDPIKDFNHYVNRYAQAVPTRPVKESSWTPNVNINESDTQYLVSAELPGVDKEDVTVLIDQKILTIKGQKTLVETEASDQWHRVESQYGAFSRQFSLPDEIEADQVAASYKNGVLTLTIPKTEKEQPKVIDVKIH